MLYKLFAIDNKFGYLPPSHRQKGGVMEIIPPQKLCFCRRQEKMQGKVATPFTL